MDTKQWWMGAGATLAEQDKINSTQIDLEAAFQVLLEKGVWPKDRRIAFKWLCEGYTAYQTGNMIRIIGKPWSPGEQDSDVANEFASATPKKGNNPQLH